MTLDERSAERLRQAFARLAEHAVPRDDCPRPEVLWAAVHGERPPDEVHRLVAHTAECGACAEAWRLARDLRGTEAGPAVDPATSPAATWWGSWASLAAAAGVAAVAFSAVWRLSGPAVERAPAAPTLRALPADNQRLPRGRAVLRWTPGPPGSRYDVQVATADLRILTRARGLDVPELALPAAALAALPHGARVVWQVEALLPDGSRITSPTFVAVLE